jgi:hypothetical protein
MDDEVVDDLDERNWCIILMGWEYHCRDPKGVVSFYVFYHETPFII